MIVGPREPAEISPMLRPTSEAEAGEHAAPPPAAPRWWSAPVGPLAEFVRFCRRERTWVVAMALLVLVWTVELFIVQGMTLVYPNAGGPRFVFWAPKIRLVLDLTFIAALVILFRRRLLVGIVVGSFLANMVLVTYFDYFFRPLSLLTVFSNWREGLQLGGFAHDLFPKFACLALAAAMAAKLAAIYMSRGAALPRSSAWMVGSLLVVGCVSMEAATNLVDPLDKIQSRRGIGRLARSAAISGPGPPSGISSATSRCCATRSSDATRRTIASRPSKPRFRSTTTW